MLEAVAMLKNLQVVNVGEIHLTCISLIDHQAVSDIKQANNLDSNISSNNQS